MHRSLIKDSFQRYGQGIFFYKILIFAILFKCILIPFTLFSQLTNNETSWHNLNAVTGYDSVFSYTINLVTSNDPIFSTYKIPNTIPEKNYAIRLITLQRDQYYYSKFIQGKLSYPQLKEIVPWIDTSNLVREDLANYISVLIYNTPEKKHFIFDRNRDSNFTNDFVYSFSLENIEDQSSPIWKKLAIPVNAMFEIMTNKKVVKQNIDLCVFPFKTSNLKVAGIDSFFFQYAEPIKLFKTDGPDSLRLYLVKHFLDTSEYVNVKVINEDGKVRDKNYKAGNSFTYKNVSYVIDSLDKQLNRIKLKKINYEDSALAIGREINMYFSNHLSGLNQTGQPISTNGYKGKYLLIDFGATWCVPCIESLPVLSGFHQTYKHSNLSLLSISVDDPSETQKVNQFIKDHKMVWDVMLPDEKSHSKASGFAQGGIPIFVLLNPEGRIIEVANGLFELSKIQSKLKTLF